MQTPIDNQSQVLSKLPLKKEEVILMQNRMDVISDEESLERVLIILEDLVLLGSSINVMNEASIPWTEPNFGCTREVLNDWRIIALKKKKSLEKEIKRLAEEEKSKNEIYAKNLKPRKLPEINAANWSRFLSLWKTEADSYPTENQKLSVIRDRMSVASDKTSTEGMESLESILTFLYNRYGSPNSIMQDSLDELETLGSPETGNNKKIEENIVQITAVLSICEKDIELSPLWTSA